MRRVNILPNQASGAYSLREISQAEQCRSNLGAFGEISFWRSDRPDSLASVLTANLAG